MEKSKSYAQEALEITKDLYGPLYPGDKLYDTGELDLNVLSIRYFKGALRIRYVKSALRIRAYNSILLMLNELAEFPLLTIFKQEALMYSFRYSYLHT